jgi:hypothetical protein
MILFPFNLLLPFSDEDGQIRREIGWQEWASLPDLGLERLRVKIDTGAKTSSLHAWQIEREGAVEDENGDPLPLLKLTLEGGQTLPGSRKTIIVPMIRYAIITDSSGRRVRRPVIRTRLVLGSVEKTIEVNVTNRQTMQFRMILGRSALESNFVVDVNREFLLGVPEGAKP